MRNPNNIMRHELIGLQCEVVSSENMNYKGISGKIIDETMKMIAIRKEKEKKYVQKKGTIFRIKLGKKTVDLNGSFIIARPEDRIKKKFKKW